MLAVVNWKGGPPDGTVPVEGARMEDTLLWIRFQCGGPPLLPPIAKGQHKP